MACPDPYSHLRHKWRAQSLTNVVPNSCCVPSSPPGDWLRATQSTLWCSNYVWWTWFEINSLHRWLRNHFCKLFYFNSHVFILSLDIYPRGQMQLWEEETFWALTDLSQKWRSKWLIESRECILYCSSQEKKKKARPGLGHKQAWQAMFRSGPGMDGHLRAGSGGWVLVRGWIVLTSFTKPGFSLSFSYESARRKREPCAVTQRLGDWCSECCQTHRARAHVSRVWILWQRPLSRPCRPFLLAHTPSGFWKSTVHPCELELELWILHLLKWTLTRKQNSHKPQDEQPCVFQPRLWSVWLTESQRDLSDW